MSNPTLHSRLAVLLITDLVASTAIKSRIGISGYTELLSRHNDLFSRSLPSSAEILKHTGDGFFALFATASDAVRFALGFQQAIRDEPWPAQPLAVRIAIHVGEVAVVPMAGQSDIVGLPADIAARLCSLALGNQILLTRFAFDEARQFVGHDRAGAEDSRPALQWIAHGPYLLKGIEDPVDVFEVGEEGHSPLTCPDSSDKAKRIVPHDQEQTLGWRPAIGLAVPDRAGWTLMRRLGEGGFGEVWLAEHDRTRQHRVFKFCFEAERLRSFKRELTLFRLLRQALGDRSDIARLYEVQLEHAPFFLESEYTEGGNLADWASAKGGIDKIPLEQRLEIVAQVAHAVAAAHSVGILHKDIKPGNILIHINSDRSIQPRLADFGIGLLADRSQLLAHNITETGFTQITENNSSRTGTRMYSPPELLAGRAFTVQGDIYALGVLLYQVVIAELEDPLAPGWERRIDDELLRQDIAACVDGDPQRRLPSASELARRLQSLPQRRTALQYERAACAAAQRRRTITYWAVASTAVLALLLILAAVGFVRERKLAAIARAATTQAQSDAAAARIQEERAKSANAYAQRQSLVTLAANAFLQKVVSAAADPSVGGRSAKASDILAHAGAQVDQALSDQPELAATVHHTLGHTYRDLAMYDDAERHLRSALVVRQKILGLTDGQTLETVRDLEQTLLVKRAFADAETCTRQAADSCRAALGPDAPRTLRCESWLADALVAAGRAQEAEPLVSRTLAARLEVLAEEAPAISVTSLNLVEPLKLSPQLLQRAGDFYRSETDRRGIQPADPCGIMAGYLTAAIEWQQGNLDRAADVLGKVRQAYIDISPAHPYALFASRDLADVLDMAGRHDQASQPLDSLIAARADKLGRDNPATLLAEDFAVLRIERTSPVPVALAARQELLERQRRALDPNDLQVIYSTHRLACLNASAGHFDHAQRLAQQALAAGAVALGDHSAALADLRNTLDQVDRATATQAAAVASARDPRPSPTLPSITQLAQPTTTPSDALVAAVAGLAQVRTGPDQPWQPVRTGMRLDANAEIRTAPRASVQLNVGDATVTIDRLGTVKLLRIITDGGKRITDVEAKYGRTRYDAESSDALHEATIRSPNSTLAVRG